MILSIILNLFREGTRLGFMLLISDILREHYGFYDFYLTAAELLKRTTSLNRCIAIGRINSIKTAQSYILNSIALGLHRKLGSKVVLTAAAKVILCLRKPRDSSCVLSKAEKAVLLSLLLKNDNEGFLPLLSFLKTEGPARVKELQGTDNWSRIFSNSRMRKLKGATRLHRLIPRLEWCIDLDLVDKRDFYKITSVGEKLIGLISEGTNNPFDVPFKLYFPGLTTENIDKLYEKFLIHLVSAYKELLLLTPNAYHVEIVAARLLTRIAFALEGLLVSHDQIDRLFLAAWKRNMQKLRFSASSVKGHAEGLIVGDRLYSYMTLSEGKLR